MWVKYYIIEVFMKWFCETNLMLQLWFINQPLTQHVSGIIMPIFRSARPCISAYGFQLLMCWVESWEAGRQVVCTVWRLLFCHSTLSMHGHTNIRLEVFVFECNLSIKLKINLSELRLCELYFLGEDSTFEICPDILNTNCIRFHTSSLLINCGM